MVSTALKTDSKTVFLIAQLQVKLEAAMALVTTKFDPQLVRGDRSIVPSETLRRGACIVC